MQDGSGSYPKKNPFHTKISLHIFLCKKTWRLLIISTTDLSRLGPRSRSISPLICVRKVGQDNTEVVQRAFNLS